MPKRIHAGMPRLDERGVPYEIYFAAVDALAESRFAEGFEGEERAEIEGLDDAVDWAITARDKGDGPLWRRALSYVDATLTSYFGADWPQRGAVPHPLDEYSDLTPGVQQWVLERADSPQMYDDRRQAPD